MNTPTPKAIALSATSVIMTIGLAAGLIANTTWGLIVMVALAVTHFGLRFAGRNGLVHSEYNVRTGRYRLVPLAGAFRHRY